MKTIRFSLLSLAAISLAMAQQARFSAPVLGYAFDPGARAVRVISGVPGSAGFEDTLVNDLDGAFVPPARGYAIAAASGDSGLRLVRFSSLDAAESALPSAGTQPSEISFSPSSESAAIYFKDAAIVEAWAGLPESPRLVFRTSVDTELRSIAISDDASAVVGATEGALLLISSEGARVLRSGNAFGAVAFLGASLDAVVADSELDQVLLLRNVTRSADASVVASEGGAGAVALAVSADNRKLVIANSRTESLLQVDLETRQLNSVPCGCKPETLARLRGNSVFRVTGTFKTDVWFFDGDAAEPRVFAIAGGNQ